VGGILAGYFAGYSFIDDVGGWRSMYGVAAPLALVLGVGMVRRRGACDAGRAATCAAVHSGRQACGMAQVAGCSFAAYAASGEALIVPTGHACAPAVPALTLWRDCVAKCVLCRWWCTARAGHAS
jgi:hypothetical protein